MKYAPPLRLVLSGRSHPTGVRGLKSHTLTGMVFTMRRTPLGCVD